MRAVVIVGLQAVVIGTDTSKSVAPRLHQLPRLADQQCGIPDTTPAPPGTAARRYATLALLYITGDTADDLWVETDQHAEV